MWSRIASGIRKRYRLYFQKSFFNKMFLVYLGITLLTGQILFLILSRNLIAIKYEQALVMSNQCLTVIDSFLQNKVTSARSIHQRLYRERDVWHMLAGDLKQAGTDELYPYRQQEIKKLVSDTMYAIDKDFNGLFLGGYPDGPIFQYGTAQATVENRFFSDYIRSSSGENGKMHLVSARNDQSIARAFSVFIMGGVMDTVDFSNEIGAIGFYFNSMKISQCYKEYSKYVKGIVYVLNDDGEILYDSSSAYVLAEDFPFAVIENQKNGTFTGGKWVYNMLYSDEYGYYVINAFAANAVAEDVRTLQASMFGVFALALLVAVLLNYISTKIFAKRLKPVTDTMEQVREGHLTSFPIQKKYDDEVGYIYTELLRMCASLDDYIQKEYVYRLRQKEMELYMLQAQIDPHFLYNTLEAIRMKLYVKGEEEASKMIWILSDLFRNMMKKEVTVTNREELNYLHSYLELFRFRLGNKMTFEFDIEEEVYRYATIKHILQPIVENALVHGIQDKASEQNPSFILITGKKEGDDIVFTVSDDGCGIEWSKLQVIRERLEKNELFQTSIGIYNVNSRLRIVYGYAYKLQIESEWGRGTSVSVRIRAMRKKELDEYVQIVDS